MTAHSDLLSRFPGRTVIVVGDLMLDHFVIGRVERISPEAPVPVVRFEQETWRLGGAANVAHNAAALGARVALMPCCHRTRRRADLVGLADPAAVIDEERTMWLVERGYATDPELPTLDDWLDNKSKRAGAENLEPPRRSSPRAQGRVRRRGASGD